MKLETSSWAKTVCIANSTISWTGDLGTESNFWMFRMPLSQLFGCWAETEDRAADIKSGQPQFEFQDEADTAGLGEEDHHFAFQDAVDVAEEAANEAATAGPASSADTCNYNIDFRSSIFIAGLLHIVHNTCDDMGEVQFLNYMYLLLVSIYV